MGVHEGLADPSQNNSSSEDSDDNEEQLLYDNAPITTNEAIVNILDLYIQNRFSKIALH